jgi:hypothetical protein
LAGGITYLLQAEEISDKLLVHFDMNFEVFRMVKSGFVVLEPKFSIQRKIFVHQDQTSQ